MLCSILRSIWFILYLKISVSLKWLNFIKKAVLVLGQVHPFWCIPSLGTKRLKPFRRKVRLQASSHNASVLWVLKSAWNENQPYPFSKGMLLILLWMINLCMFHFSFFSWPCNFLPEIRSIRECLLAITVILVLKL